TRPDHQRKTPELFFEGVIVATRPRGILTPPPCRGSIPSPHDGGVGRVRERGFQLATPIRWKLPLSPTLPARASQGEGAGGFRDGGGIQMRHASAPDQIQYCPIRE